MSIYQICEVCEKRSTCKEICDVLAKQLEFSKPFNTMDYKHAEYLEEIGVAGEFKFGANKERIETKKEVSKMVRLIVTSLLSSGYSYDFVAKVMNIDKKKVSNLTSRKQK